MTSQIMNNENFAGFQNGMQVVMLNSEFSLCGLIGVMIKLRPKADTGKY